MRGTMLTDPDQRAALKDLILGFRLLDDAALSGEMADHFGGDAEGAAANGARWRAAVARIREAIARLPADLTANDRFGDWRRGIPHNRDALRKTAEKLLLGRDHLRTLKLLRGWTRYVRSHWRLDLAAAHMQALLAQLDPALQAELPALRVGDGIGNVDDLRAQLAELGIDDSAAEYEDLG